MYTYNTVQCKLVLVSYYNVLNNPSFDLSNGLILNYAQTQF